jgi:hypothetical protein
VRKRVLIGFVIATVMSANVGCSTADNANHNTNGNMATAKETIRPAPDDSEITTSIDPNGVKTETRVFHNNPRVAKVVVTTRDGKRTTTIYAPSGESKDLKEEAGDALVATGNALADAAGFVAEKTVELADKTKEGAKKVGEKTAEGAKTVGEKTAEGAKKTGKAIKKAIP